MKIGYQIPLYDGPVAFNTISQKGQWIMSWLIFKNKGWKCAVQAPSMACGSILDGTQPGWQGARGLFYLKHSVERANGTGSQLLLSPVGAQELFWRTMLEFDGRWPLLTPAVLAPSASALGKKRMYAVCERLPTSVRQHSSNLAIISSNKRINYGDMYICMHRQTHLYLPILTPKSCPNHHVYLRNMGLF